VEKEASIEAWRGIGSPIPNSLSNARMNVKEEESTYGC